MFQSLKLGRLLGIDLYVHGTFWLLPLLVLFGGFGADGPGGIPVAMATLFAVFGCVALHELGHALAAAGFGIRTRDITLSPIGGVARLERMPETALPEIAIALAGPAVNVVIAMGLGAVLVANYAVGSAAVYVASPVQMFLERVFLANVGLVVFNLIPAFPMDGGRVFRAALSLFSNRESATAMASGVGSVIAGLFVLWGIVSIEPFLALIGVAVFLMGRAELASVREREAYKRAVRGQAQMPWIYYPNERVWTR